MPRTKKIEGPNEERPALAGEKISLTAFMSKKLVYKTAIVWLVGDTPLITHSWSEKAKNEILFKQVKATRGGREPRDPEGDFINSMYPLGDGHYGFPATGVKDCILSSAHKDKGIAKVDVRAALHLVAPIIAVKTAKAGAKCDIPLVRIWGSDPEMREDMVKVGKGLNKLASLAYRAQFRRWGLRIVARFDPQVLTPEAFAFLIAQSGIACGIGEWRNERNGIFGSFHMAMPDEEAEWERFSRGKGSLPEARESWLLAAE